MVSCHVVTPISGQKTPLSDEGGMPGGRAGIEGRLWMSDMTHVITRRGKTSCHVRQRGFYSLERGTSSTEVDGTQAAGKGFNLLLSHV